MKKLYKYAVLAVLAGLSFAACQKESSELDTSDKLVKMTFAAGNPEFAPQVRTEIEGLTPYWSPGDVIGISTDGIKTNFPFTNDASERTATTTFSGSTNVSATIFAYYPYTANGIGKVEDNTGAKVDLPANQSPTATSFDGKADILVSKPLTLTASGQQVAALEFRRLSAIVKVVLKDQSTGSKLSGQHVSSLSITTDGNNTLAGRVVVDLFNYTMQAPYYNGTNTVTATYTTKTEYAVDGTSGTYLSVYPRLLAAGSKLTVEASTEGYVINKAITLPTDVDLETGKVTTLNINLSDENITATSTGLSLPFSDDFSDLTGSGTSVDITSRKDASGNKLYSADSYAYQYNKPHGLRLSTSSNTGNIVTSELNLSEPFSVLISAKAWPKDVSGIKITAGESAVMTTGNLTEEFKTYLLKFDAQSAKTKVTIEPSATKKRIIIESIRIVPGHDITLPPVLKITSETTLSVPAESTTKTINYTVENPTNGVSVVASSDVSWLNSFGYDTGGVSFTIDANQGEERSGTITLSYEGAEAQTVSVTQLTAGEAIKSYVKVTADLADWSGSYIISAGTSAANGTITSKWLKYTPVSIANDQIESNATTDALAAVIEKNADGYYTIKFSSGFLMTTNDNAGINVTSTATNTNAQWSFSIDNGNVSIANRETPGRILRCNGSSGYRTYTGTTGTLPSLYRLSN